MTLKLTLTKASLPNWSDARLGGYELRPID